MSKNSIKYLEWDSDFFGLSTAKAVIKKAEDFSDVIEDAQQKKIKLVYLFCENPLPATALLQLDIQLVDEKLTYTHSLTNDMPNVDPHIRLIDQSAPILNLEELALRSGQYSRFKIDERLPNRFFEKLYKKWLHNSLSGELGTKVAVLQTTQDQYDGFITLGKIENSLNIGLLSVAENQTGKGVGTKLIQFVLNEASLQRLQQCTVVTQASNQPASRLYEKSGFNLSNREFIYHLWLT